MRSPGKTFFLAAFWLWNTLAAGAQSFPSPSDWRDLTMYMIFTDRFADGDPANNELTPGARCRPSDVIPERSAEIWVSAGH